MKNNWLSLAVVIGMTVSSAHVSADGPRLVASRGQRPTGDGVVVVRTASARSFNLRQTPAAQPPTGQPLLAPEAYPAPQGYPVSPAPQMGTALMPVPDGLPIPMPEVGCELYPNVRYRDERKIAPCAVPMIVSVKDPCVCVDPCDCCATAKCVNVKICVPPCDCADIKVTRNGNKVKYCFGKYVVEITSRKGKIVVDYDRRLLVF